MLLQRILTSFALLFVVLAAVFYLPPRLFFLFIAVVIAISVWEWSALAGLENLLPRAVLLVVMLALMWVCLHAPVPVALYFVIGLGFWVTAFLFVYSYKGIKRGTATRQSTAL